jgi:hypothetical protein
MILFCIVYIVLPFLFFSLRGSWFRPNVGRNELSRSRFQDTIVASFVNTNSTLNVRLRTKKMIIG